MTDPGFWTITRLRAAYRARELSPVEMTEHMLARIDRFDGELHSYQSVAREGAVEQARRLEARLLRGDTEGALFGVPVCVKDNIETADLTTTAGLVSHRAYIPERDADAVGNLVAEGAIVLGKAAMTEGAFSSYAPGFEAPVNPWCRDLWPGVSSSGSGVALAAGLTTASLGTDAGGSTRLPASANGVCAIKATKGLVPTRGLLPPAPNPNDISPMARTVRDTALVLGAAVGGEFPGAVDGDWRVGIDESWMDDQCDAETQRVFREAVRFIRQAGIEVVPIEVGLPDSLVHDFIEMQTAEVAASWMSVGFPHFSETCTRELNDLVAAGQRLPAIRYLELTALRDRVQLRLDQLFAERGLTAILLPVTPSADNTLESVAGYAGREMLDRVLSFTLPWNCTGHPALAFPVAFTLMGSPTGMQLVGPRSSDGSLLAMTVEIERSVGFQGRDGH